MKAFLFLLFLLVIAGGAWFVAPSVETDKILTEENQVKLVEGLESVLNSLAARFPDSPLERAAADRLGLCQVMTPPVGGVQAKPIAGARFPFGQDVDASKASLLCAFPGHGKSVLIVTYGKTLLRMTRRPERTAVFSLPAGNLTMVSDQLALDFAVPGMQLKLRSEKPVILNVSLSNGIYFLLVKKGTLDVTWERGSHGASPSPVVFQLMPGTVLTSEEKVVSERASMILLPSGFREDTSPTPGASPSPGLPPAQSQPAPATAPAKPTR